MPPIRPSWDVSPNPTMALAMEKNTNGGISILRQFMNRVLPVVMTWVDTHWQTCGVEAVLSAMDRAMLRSAAKTSLYSRR